MARVLVAGVGNIFFGDDAFGCEVARALSTRPQPDDVVVRDFGIRTLDLSYALLDGVERLILIDAMARGGAPGTLYVLAPEMPTAPASGALGGHGVTAEQVVSTALALGAAPPALRVVGCEPFALGSELEPLSALSPAVRAAVPRAVELVEGLLEEVWD
jgi:hydrogenase maturation protease